ncbi:GNAT family N-acetyltransferase [Mucisphaera sp.]|uniref:GNAT family N-acetyltransferase n=1 Tax=Mucisphaera sp. TaxID=2913024 RepID=UPI003D133D4B
MAISLLLTGAWSDPGAAVDGFRAYLAQQNLKMDRFWVALHRETPISAVLVVPGQGNAAMVFVSPTRSRKQVEALSHLLEHARKGCRDLDGYLLQVLLEPSQKLERQAVRQAGFEHLADLGYLQRSIRQAAEPSRTSIPGYRILNPETAPPGWLEQAILDSYEQTLDCPKLVGRRHIDDIVAGHRATGVYDPTLWFILAADDEDQPAAVALINPLIQPGGHELVYLGVSVAHRRKGLAAKLLQLAIAHIAQRQPSATLFLAVDLRNAPALRLYHGLGFRQTAERAAYLDTV